jgi:hypothetical protein
MGVWELMLKQWGGDQGMQQKACASRKHAPGD